MNKQQEREDIESFCRDFLKKKRAKKDTYTMLLINYRHIFAQIDIQQVNLTQKTFDRSFKRICRKLFDTRPADKNYIIPLLGFALTLHEYYQSNYYSWYHIEILIDSLTDVLAGVGF